uniref:Egl-9 family hypoxia inducible factor 3 n=1 Tax=Anolis carolinensis TaxID=28377 RepID=A0A803T309_ANOCA|nr:PREDICTED: egl nine homolog 3 [Anolis carolinensis]|eukprot:XP_008101624.1 PREDICTED: egl nine homolog 3 [Anolis carolinensis]
MGIGLASQCLVFSTRWGTFQRASPAMPLGNIKRLELEKIALDYIVPCLHDMGFCYLDNFLGELVGDCVLARVKQMHYNGELQDGQLAGQRQGIAKRHLRGDQIKWIAGTEEGCEAIHFLLSLIDRLVMYCGSRLGKYYVKERSKAMVACYPGNGTGYVRHVDNPNGDGRCITCIYYLNKNWDSKVCRSWHFEIHMQRKLSKNALFYFSFLFFNILLEIVEFPITAPFLFGIQQLG